MKVSPIWPAKARDCKVETPIVPSLARWKTDGEAVHLAAEQGLHRFGRHVARREAGAAGADDQVDLRVACPGRDLRLDRLDLVGHDRAPGEVVARAGHPLGQQVAGLVGLVACACPTPPAPRS